MQEELNHPIYPRSSLSEADGVAWVFTNKDSQLTQYPFKFPPLAPTEVRLKILHTSICRSDIMTARQLWGPTTYPLCTGHEVIGEITVVGSKVTHLKVGDSVGVSPLRYNQGKCRYCAKGLTNLCQEVIFLYGAYFGGYCTHMQIDANWAFKLPAGLELFETSPLLCAGATVYGPLKRYLKIGGTCAIIGIGGLGHLALQYANKLGFKVTAFTTRTNNVQSLKALGASQIQHSTDYQLLAKNEGKYDVVLSTLFVTDTKIYKLHHRLTKPGGVYIMLGYPALDISYQLDVKHLMDEQIKIVGSFVGSIDSVTQMLQFSAQYGIKSINEYFEFQDFNKALHRAEKQNPRYRAVVNVTNWAKKNGFDK